MQTQLSSESRCRNTLIVNTPRPPEKATYPGNLVGMAGGFEGEGGSRQREVRGDCSPRAWAVRGGQLGLAMVSKSGKQVPQSGNKSPKQLFAKTWGRPAPSLICPCMRPVPGQQGGGT